MDFMDSKGRSMKSFPPGSQGRKSLTITSRKRTDVKQKKTVFCIDVYDRNIKTPILLENTVLLFGGVVMTWSLHVSLTVLELAM